MRIRTSDSAEFRFWLTRRYVKLLWPIVVKMLETNKQIALQENPDAKRAVLSFQHENAIQQSDFATEFGKDVSELPLGETPIVLAKIQIKHREDGTNILCMHPERGEGIELAMNEVLLHSFSKLLSDAVAVSSWDIALKLSPPTAGGETAPKRMN